MTNKDKGFCKAHVWQGHQCSNIATKGEYCGTHHPDAEKKREEKREKKYQELRKKLNEIREREQYDRLAGEYCRRMGKTKEQLEKVQ